MKPDPRACPYCHGDVYTSMAVATGVTVSNRLPVLIAFVAHLRRSKPCDDEHNRRSKGRAA